MTQVATDPSLSMPLTSKHSVFFYHLMMGFRHMRTAADTDGDLRSAQWGFTYDNGQRILVTRHIGSDPTQIYIEARVYTDHVGDTGSKRPMSYVLNPDLKLLGPLD